LAFLSFGFFVNFVINNSNKPILSASLPALPFSSSMSPHIFSTHAPSSGGAPALSGTPLASSLSLFPTVPSIRNLSDAEFVLYTHRSFGSPALSTFLRAIRAGWLCLLYASLASLPLFSCIIPLLRWLLPLTILTLVGRAYTLPNLLRPRLSLL
jgi:hypothetical protein